MSISASPGRLSCGSSLLAGGPLCIILGALCFSTTGTVQALAPDGSHPLGIGALRMQIGALALWAWCACRHSLPAGLRHWQLRWLIPATLGLLGFQVFFFWGVAAVSGWTWAGVCWGSRVCCSVWKAAGFSGTGAPQLVQKRPPDSASPQY